MKRILAILLIVGLIFSVGTVVAETWICGECQTENDDLFCGNCGAKKPLEEWTCPDCGKINTTNFCTHCGKEKSIITSANANIVSSSDEDQIKERIFSYPSWLTVTSDGKYRRVKILNDDLTVAVGDELYIEVEANIPEGTLLSKKQVELWTYDTNIATVSEDGIVVGISPGTTWLQCNFADNLSICCCDEIKVVKKDTNDKSNNSQLSKVSSILDVSQVKSIIRSCPSLTNITKSTVDYYDSKADYEKAFPNRNSVHTWRIGIQSGVIYFADENKMTVLTVRPNGTSSEMSTVLKWERDLLKLIPDLKEIANSAGVKLVAEKRVDGGDYASFADSNGVIDLTNSSKLNGVISTMSDSIGLLEVVNAFGTFGDLDSNGN